MMEGVGVDSNGLEVSLEIELSVEGLRYTVVVSVVGDFLYSE